VGESSATGRKRIRVPIFRKKMKKVLDKSIEYSYYYFVIQSTLKWKVKND